MFVLFPSCVRTKNWKQRKNRSQKSWIRYEPLIFIFFGVFIFHIWVLALICFVFLHHLASWWSFLLFRRKFHWIIMYIAAVSDVVFFVKLVCRKHKSFFPDYSSYWNCCSLFFFCFCLLHKARNRLEKFSVSWATHTHKKVQCISHSCLITSGGYSVQNIYQLWANGQHLLDQPTHSVYIDFFFLISPLFLFLWTNWSLFHLVIFIGLTRIWFTIH